MDDGITSADFFNPNRPLNGYMISGIYVTQSDIYYEMLAREQFEANRERDMEMARAICATYAGTAGQ